MASAFLSCGSLYSVCLSIGLPRIDNARTGKSVKFGRELEVEDLFFAVLSLTCCIHRTNSLSLLES